MIKALGGFKVSKLRHGMLGGILLSLLFLGGCGGANPAETIYQYLEKAVVLEEMFEEQQQPLIEAEQKEHELYEEIISLGMSELEEIVTLSEQAIEIVDTRQSLIEQEKMSIEAGYNEFEKIKEELDNIREENVRDVAEKMIVEMEGRYAAYQSLHESYSSALVLDRELYEMLQQEDLSIDELQEQIDKINEAYELVMTYKEEFNEKTENYNELKRSFYQEAQLDVTFRD